MKKPYLLAFLSVIKLNAVYAEQPTNIEDLLALPLTELIETEIISSTKIATKISAAPSSITVYNHKDIKYLGARKLSDILILVPGIQIQTKGNNREKLWVRGVQSEFNNKIALYIDNIPLRNAFNEFQIDEELPIESIKKIEIIRGPGSALYGANAFAAVINIFTFQANEREQNIVKLSLGEANTQIGYFSVAKNINQFANVMLEGKLLNTDGRNPDYDRKGIANNRDATQQLGYIRFKSSALDNKLNFSASYSHFDNERIDKSYPTENSRQHGNMRFSIAYQQQFEQWGIDANSYYTQSTRLESETKYQSLTDLSIKESFDFIDSTELIGSYAALNYQPITSNKIIFGVDIKNERLLNSSFTDNITQDELTFIQPQYENMSLFDTGIFLQDQQSFFDNKTQFTVGLRFDILELFEDQFSYRLGLTHAFTDSISAKLLYGTAYRSPSFLEFTRSPVGSVLPDVENIETIEAQISYYTSTLQTSLTVYHNHYANFIARKNSFIENANALDAGVFANIDSHKATGVELESKYLINEHWTSFLNASWSVAESNHMDKKLPLLADWTLTAGLEWHHQLGLGELFFNNHIITYGQRKEWPSDTWNVGQQQRQPNREANFNDGFVTWNSALHYKIKVHKQQLLEFSLTAHNLLDKKYYTQSIITPKANAAVNFDSQYQGRHVRVGISYQW